MKLFFVGYLLFSLFIVVFFNPSPALVSSMGLVTMVFCFSNGLRIRSLIVFWFSFLLIWSAGFNISPQNIFYILSLVVFAIISPGVISFCLAKILNFFLPPEIRLSFFSPGKGLLGGAEFPEKVGILSPENSWQKGKKNVWVEEDEKKWSYWNFIRKNLPGKQVSAIIGIEKTHCWSLERLLWDLDDLFFFLDPSGKIVAANPAGKKFLDGGENIIGREFISFLKTETGRKFSSIFNRVQQGAVAAGFSQEHNSEKWKWEIKAISGEENQIVGFSVRAKNITGCVRVQQGLKKRLRKVREQKKELLQEIDERKKTEEMLIAEKEKLDITLHSIGEGVITTDERNLVVRLNRSATEITGWRPEEVIGKNLESFFRVTQKKSPGNDREKSTLLSTKKGEMKVISETRSPIKNREGRKLGQVIIFRDITARKHVEDQVIVSQKMESIGQLAAGIAHEINTPMQYIGDNLSFLQKAFASLEEYVGIPEGRAGHLIEEIPNALKDAVEGAQRVNRLVLSMKNFAHPGDSEMKLGDINRGIKSTVEIARNEWKYAAEVELDLDPTLPGIGCIMEKINQVFLNMVINSAQAIIEARNKGIIERGIIKIKTRALENLIQVIIEDNGIGIPPEIKNRIFDPFFTTKEVGKGTGQGLTIAHDIIVNKHNGELFVESEPGKGTRFIINLPLANTVAIED